MWMLGDVFQKSEKKDVAANYFARIVRDYPLSPLVPAAKGQLKAMGAPVPPPDPKALAWMTAEQNAPRPHTSLASMPMALIKGGPAKEMQTASRVGAPNMTPEADEASEMEVLRGGAATTIGTKGVTGIVTTVTPGGAPPSGTAENTAPSGEPVNAPADSAPATTPGNEAGPNAAVAPAATGEPTSATPAATSTATPGGAAKTDAAAATAPTADAAKTDGTTPAADSKDVKESSSKKKKGLKKLVPW